MLLVDKWKPIKSSDIISQKKEIAFFKNWLLNWESTKKPLFMYGPPGIGKTLIIELVSKELNWDLVGNNFDDDFIDNIKKIIKNPFNYFSNKKKIVCIENIDCISERGFLPFLRDNADIMPMIFTVNDKNDLNISNFSKNCVTLRINVPNSNEIYSFIEKIIKAENLNLNEEKLKSIIESSKGDIRYILNSLQFFKKILKSKTKRELKDFDKMSFFDSTTYLFNIVHENIRENVRENVRGNVPFEELEHVFKGDYYYINLLIFQNDFVKDVKDVEKQDYVSDWISFTDTYEEYITHDSLGIEVYTYLNLGSIYYIDKSIAFPGFPEYLGKTSKQTNNANKLKLLKYSSQELSFIFDILVYYASIKDYQMCANTFNSIFRTEFQCGQSKDLFDDLLIIAKKTDIKDRNLSKYFNKTFRELKD